ncbi:MAG: signal peptidase I [Oscillospiraceae bacterium]|nr:signal peptidase I [Oscillospiraceae bacterium]
MDENKEINELENEAVAGATESEENEGGKKKKSLGREILEWCEAIVVAVLVALVIRSFVFTVVRVDGSSMDHTLANNDRLIVWRLGYEPKQGDIVIFEPNIPENQGKSLLDRIYWVKRVIAVGGQHVEIDYSTNSVYVDGVKLDEPYLPENMNPPADTSTIRSIDIPEGQIFLMGDNRNNSRDSRYIGPVDEDDVVGTAVLRFWPFTSFGGVD